MLPDTGRAQLRPGLPEMVWAKKVVPNEASSIRLAAKVSSNEGTVKSHWRAAEHEGHCAGGTGGKV